jgi:hypothetical protein
MYRDRGEYIWIWLEIGEVREWTDVPLQYRCISMLSAKSIQLIKDINNERTINKEAVTPKSVFGYVTWINQYIIIK